MPTAAGSGATPSPARTSPPRAPPASAASSASAATSARLGVGLDTLAHGAQVVPHRLARLARVVPQEVGGVVGRHDGEALPLEPAAADPGDRDGPPEQRRDRRLAESDDRGGRDRVQLLVQERLGRGETRGGRRAVPSGGTLHDVAEVHVLAPPADGLDHLGEELARAPDEGPAAPVLLLARSLADEDDARGGIAFAEHEVRALLAEWAAAAIAELGAHELE